MRLPFRPIAALLLLGLGACGGGEEAAPRCESPCAPYQHCEEGVCVCDEGFVDCDADPTNGCEPAVTCGCTYEGDAAFCERHGASCGHFGGRDDCGNWRVIDCGGCPDGLTCGAEAPHQCGTGQCRPQPDEAICALYGWHCGGGFGADRCGTPMDLDCGSCATGLKCTTQRMCVAVSGLFGPCASDQDCADPLVCASDGLGRGICIELCTGPGDCTEGLECAVDYFRRGEGLCGDVRTWGEACLGNGDPIGFCHDPSPTRLLACISSACHYVCAIYGEGHWECPSGFICHPEWWESPEVGAAIRICMPL